MSTGAININNIRQEFTLAIHEIVGYGGAESPCLLVPISFSLIPYRRGNDFPYSEFNLIFLSAELYLTSKNFKAAEISIPIQFKIYQPTIYQIVLRFRLNRDIIFQIEKCREGNLPASLIFNLQIAKYEPSSGVKGTIPQPPGYVSGFELVQGHTVFAIEQSQWVNKILPALGHQAATLIELPTTSLVFPDEFAISITELEESRKYFVAGAYDKTAGHCRAAIEPFKKEFPRIRASVASKSEYEWIKKNLEATCDYIETIMNATYTITNKSHHPPTTGNFGRSETEIILNMTILILAYIGKIMP